MVNLSHRQARSLLQTAADGLLKPKAQVRLNAHLATCNECRQYADGLRLLEAELRRTMHTRWGGKNANLPFAAFQARSKGFRMRKAIWNSVKALGAAALLVALFFLANTFLPHPGAPNTSEASATPALPTASQIRTASPASGRIPAGIWDAMTDFGAMLLTVEYSGPGYNPQVTNIHYVFAKWTCGAIFGATSLTDNSTWPIADNSFTAHSTFDQNGPLTMTVQGRYDPAAGKLSGTWERTSQGTTCSGNWEISPNLGALKNRAGEWTAATDFGRISFTINSTGVDLTGIHVVFNPNWTCGTATNLNDFGFSGGSEGRTPSFQSPDTVGGYVVTFGPSFLNNKADFNFEAAYDETSQTFRGTWELVAGTTVCKGDWKASRPVSPAPLTKRR